MAPTASADTDAAATEPMTTRRCRARWALGSCTGGGVQKVGSYCGCSWSVMVPPRVGRMPYDAELTGLTSSQAWSKHSACCEWPLEVARTSADTEWVGVAVALVLMIGFPIVFGYLLFCDDGLL